MDELIVNGKNVISPADFHRDKAELAKIRGGIPTNTNLPYFKENNWIFDANVKGKDMNGLVTSLQGKLTSIHNTELGLTNVVDAFISAFESLDKGYLQGICIAVKAGQEADKQASDALDKIKATLEVLKQFKDELKENTQHLNDIDVMWSDVQDVLEKCRVIEKNLGNESSLIKNTSEKLQKLQNKINGVKHMFDADKVFSDVKKLESARQDITKDVHSLSVEINELKNYHDALKSIVHLHDVDTMYTDCIQIKENIQQLQNQINTNLSTTTEDIRGIKEEYAEFGISVDSRFMESEKLFSGYKDEFSLFKDTMNEKLEDVDGRFCKVEKNHVDLSGSVSQTKTEVEVLKSKLKISYFVLGGTAALTIIQLILHLVGVM